MNYETSSQRSRWQYIPEKLLEVRKEKRTESLEAIRRATTESTAVDTSGQQDGAGKLRAVKLEEAAKLLRYYADKIQQTRTEFSLPRKVAGAALMFLQRVYLHFSVLDFDPADLFICCLYLACKVEEHYMSAEALAKGFGLGEESVLRYESILLEALQFDLITHPPYRAIDGFLQDITDSRSRDGTEAVSSLGIQATSQQLSQARQYSLEAADMLLLTDAPLLFPPAQLGLNAVRTGLRKVGISFTPYLQHAALVLSPQVGSATDAAAPSAVEYLKAQMDRIDAYGQEGTAQIDQKELKRIDRKLKQCRNWAMDPKSKVYKAAEAQRQQQQAAQRAQKLADRKRKSEAQETEALGWGQSAAAPIEAAPSKRLRT